MMNQGSLVCLAKTTPNIKEAWEWRYEALTAGLPYSGPCPSDIRTDSVLSVCNGDSVY